MGSCVGYTSIEWRTPLLGVCMGFGILVWLGEKEMEKEREGEKIGKEKR